MPIMIVARCGAGHVNFPIVRSLFLRRSSLSRHPNRAIMMQAPKVADVRFAGRLKGMVMFIGHGDVVIDQLSEEHGRLVSMATD